MFMSTNDGPAKCCKKKPKHIRTIELRPGHSFATYQCTKCKTVHQYDVYYDLCDITLQTWDRIK